MNVSAKIFLRLLDPQLSTVLELGFSNDDGWPKKNEFISFASAIRDCLNLYANGSSR